VILVDANLLTYAYSSNFPQHATARAWLDQQIKRSARVGLPWASLLAFLRITTNPRMFSSPVPMSKAWAQVEVWLACDTVWYRRRQNVTPVFSGACFRKETYWAIWFRMLTLPHWRLSTDSRCARLMVISRASQV
jgi:predicted nucleic acid-binding protein